MKKPKNFIVARDSVLGKTFDTKSSGRLQVTGYDSSNEVTVLFLDTGFKTTTHLSLIRSGNVRDITLPHVLGVGYTEGLPTRNEFGGLILEYSYWQSMLARCYDKSKSKGIYSVSEDFLHYPIFKDWCKNQIGFGNDGWHLDKDILVKGNTIYSESTCCFVPVEINCIFGSNKKVRGDNPIGVYYDTGRHSYQAHLRLNGIRKSLGRYKTRDSAFIAYKDAKESYIKQVAEKWKDQIDSRVYESLIGWEVCISD